MNEHIRDIQYTLTMFPEKTQGITFYNAISELYSVAFAKEYSQNMIHHQSIAHVIPRIIQDVENISNCVDRFEFYRKDIQQNQMVQRRWLEYMKTDIQHVHVDLRSILDYAKDLIVRGYNLYGHEAKSFSTFINRISHHQHKVGSELISLIHEYTPWLYELRNIRDLFVHHGGEAFIIFDPLQGILFELSNTKLMLSLQQYPFLMYTPRFISFEKYLSLYLSKILTFVDKLSTMIIRRINPEYEHNPEFGLRILNPSFSVMTQWLRNLLEELQ